MIDYSSDLGEWLRFAAGVLAGGLISTYAAHRLQLRRSKRELTIRLVESFSSLKAHDLRMKVWALFWRVPDAPFDVLDKEANDEERAAFRYVLGYFVQAGSLIEHGAIDEKLFFALSQRWMLEIFEMQLSTMSRSNTAEHYRTHYASLSVLGEAWKR